MTEPELGVGDAVTAMVEWLTADALIAEAIGDDLTFIVGHELPLEKAGSMPRPAIVVSDAGGFHEGLPEVLDRSRIDVRSYGRTLDEAKRIAVLVRLRIKALRRFVSSLGVLIHAPQASGGYIPLREQVGGWPLVLRSYLVLYDERFAA